MNNPGNSYVAIHPGEMLKDELQYRNISQKQFAETLGVSPTMLNEILNGKRPVTPEFALLIEAALGIKAYIFVNLQTDHDLRRASLDKKVIMRLNRIKEMRAALY